MKNAVPCKCRSSPPRSRRRNSEELHFFAHLTSKGTATYGVTSSSDIDKNGEGALKDLAVGDAVRFSVDATKATQIDELHAGNEALNRPAAPDVRTTQG